MQEFYFEGTELGTQMFLPLAVLAEQLLDGIRVPNAGKGLTDHLLESTHSTEEETEAKGVAGWHTQLVARGNALVTSFAHVYIKGRFKGKSSIFYFNPETMVDVHQLLFSSPLSWFNKSSLSHSNSCASHHPFS